MPMQKKSSAEFRNPSPSSTQVPWIPKMALLVAVAADAFALIPTCTMALSSTKPRSLIGPCVKNPFHVVFVIEAKSSPFAEQPEVAMAPGKPTRHGMFCGPPNFPLVPHVALPTTRSLESGTPTTTNW